MTVLAFNKRAGFDYQLLETFEAGIELKGFEVKAMRNGRIQLGGAYVISKNNELWLVNADISPYQNQPQILAKYDSKRSRRLLLTKKEIQYLVAKLKQKGLTLVPLEVYTKNRFLKIKIGLAKARKKVDKRELLKKREIEKEMKRAKFD